MSVSPALAKTPLSISTSSPVNGVSPVTPLTPLTNGLSRSSSQQNVDTDSGKSSCSPALLDCSFDSGIVMAVNDLQMHKRIQQCKRILIALERDKEAYRKLRERLSKIVDKKSKKHKTEPENCNVCCTAIALDDTKSFVKCCLCNKHICRNLKCADWLPQAAQWECQLCHSTKESLAHTSSWVADQMSFNQQKLTYPMRARSEIYIPINDCNDSFMQFESVSQIGLNTNDAISNEQKQKIREYVEEVVASMLGGSLDSIKVNQMSKSENYLQLFIRYHKKMSNILLLLENALQYKALKGDLPAVINGHNITAATSPTNNNNHNDLADISQTRLKQLIEAIITETLRLPVLSSNAVSEVSLDTRSHADTAPPLTNGHTRRHRVEHYFEPKNYQDLLATAVLNKIVDKQNNGRLLSESTPELHVGGHGIDRNFNVETQSTASGSSVEPRSDCSLTDTETADKDAADFRNLGFGRESALSDYVASHMVPLPDLSAPVTESDEDDYASVTSSMVGEGTWADNWLFKKKKPAVNSPILAGGNGMLVPAPKEDIRAQIGDKTTDEISDLSEMGSDTEDSSLDVMHANLDPLNDRLLNKQLIGGQNSKIILDELIETASSISATPTIEIKPAILETTNAHVVDNIAKTEAINLNVTNAQFNPLSGSIAEREHMKWNNAVEMPNNPYAPDALKRRISGSQEKTIDFPNISPCTEQNPMDLLKTDTEPTEQEQQQESDYKRYSRDYYINDVQPAKSCPKRQTAFEITLSANIDEPATDNIVINEVISNSNGTKPSSPISKNLSDCHWTLSTPVRRSSSLKFINNISPLSHYNNNPKLSPTTPISQLSIPPPPRSYTSTSHYNDIYINGDHEDDDDNDDEFDTKSQRSWQSATLNFSPLSLNHKRRTLSSLSFHSNGSHGSFKSLNLNTNKKRKPPNPNILTQFEKQLLHKDMKRNSFRAVSATTKDFVLNPLYNREEFYGIDGKPKLILKTDATDDQVDSGVDSYLNGFNETDAKHSSSSLLF